MKRKIISGLCILSMLSTVAFAAPIDNVEEDSSTGNIKISGDFSAQCNYSVLLIKPNVDPDSLSDVSDEDIMNNITYMLNTATPDGGYSIEIPMPANSPSGIYTVSVSSAISAEPTRHTILWYNPEEIANIFETLKNAGSGEDILNIINSEENCNKLGLPYELIKNLSSADKTALAKQIYLNKESITDIASLKNLFIDHAILKAIPASKTAEEAQDLITKYASSLDISESETFKKFAEKDDNYKKSTAKRLIGTEISNTTEFATLFKTAAFLADIACSASAADVNKILNENRDLLSGKIDKYFTISNTSAYDKKIAGKEYNNIDTLENDIVKLINSSGSTGGSGGGGGISGSPLPSTDNSAVISNPVVTLPPSNFFDDLDSAEWAKNAIESLANAGVISGKGNNKFCPEDFVKREEFVKMLVGSFNVTAEGSVPFNDVDAGQWYYSYVVSAYNSGMVNGVSADMFGTGTNITRQDMAVLVYRYLSKDTELPSSGTVEFTDKVEISEYAREAVAALREAGIVSGMEDGSFRPQENCTRAQVAYIIYKALKYAGKM